MRAARVAHLAIQLRWICKEWCRPRHVPNAGPDAGPNAGPDARCHISSAACYIRERIRFRTIAPGTHHILSHIVQSCDLNNIANAVAHADYSSCNDKMTNEICQPTCLTGYQTVTPASPIDRVRDQGQVSHVQAAHPTVHQEPNCFLPGNPRCK